MTQPPSVYDKIIWSADVPDVDKLEEYLDQMPLLKIVKIDRLFVENNDWTVFDLLSERGLLVFDDAKLAEIPIKLEALAKTHVRRANPWMLNCMLGNASTGNLTGPAEKLDGLKRFADVCRNSGVIPCGVTVLTSKKPALVLDEYNGRDFTGQVMWYIEIALEAGITNIVCSPKEVKAIRRVFEDAVELNTPGVRRQIQRLMTKPVSKLRPMLSAWVPPDW